ncbi:MAG: hypothetical protein L0Y61_06920, partial [Epsilonproteobacteria bacterium]|nr:hypothetical protein [Campylobacterota bacterium]
MIDRENPQSYFVSFDSKRTQNFKRTMQKFIEEKEYFIYLDHTSPKDKSRIYNDKQLSYYVQKPDAKRVTKLPAIHLSIQDEKSMDNMIEKTHELWRYLCLSHSLDLLDDDDFKDQKFIDEMKRFIEALFEKGFALRVNKKYKDVLDIYPLEYFKPHEASERDCIGFIKKYHSSWQIFLDFLEDVVDESLGRKLSLISTSTISNKVRWIKFDIQDIEDLNLLTDVILKQAEFYKPSKLAIWPQQLQKEMILNHGQTDTGFFILLKYILSGRNKYVEIYEEFKSMQLDKELDRTLRGSALFETEAGYESPFYVEGNDENMTIGYKPFLEDTL